MKGVSEHFEKADGNTLAIFDVDMVLVQPEDPAFQMANMKQYRQVAKKIMQELPAGTKDIFLNLMSLNSESLLIDTQAPALMRSLTERKTPAMALTSQLTGKLLHVESMEKFKIDRLNKLGIDFSLNAPYGEDIVFRDLPLFRGNYSLYTRGMLFVNGSICPKGEALIAFLKVIDFSPNKIIFVDDREENLKSVEASLQQYNPAIVYKGVLFTGANDYPSTAISQAEFEARWQALAHQAKSKSS